MWWRRPKEPAASLADELSNQGAPGFNRSGRFHQRINQESRKKNLNLLVHGGVQAKERGNEPSVSFATVERRKGDSAASRRQQAIESR